MVVGVRPLAAWAYEKTGGDGTASDGREEVVELIANYCNVNLGTSVEGCNKRMWPC